MNLITLSYLLLLYISESLAVLTDGRNTTGYAEGMISDCPGSSKPAFITKKSLRFLGLVVVGRKTSLISAGQYYNYYEARKIPKDPDIDFRKKTMIFCSGYGDYSSNFVSRIMGNAYKKLGYNVIVIEAFYFLVSHYPRASRILRPIGLHYAEMLTNLTAAGMDPKKIELSGISIGAHTASFIAKHFYKITGTKLARVTGLDPSGPCFRARGPEDRIDKSDADFVDLIITNMDGYGMGPPVGHSNFYINGGEYQPHDVLAVPCAHFCSHMKSYIIWYVAIQNPKSFIGVKCDSVDDARSRQCYDRIPLESNLVGPLTNKSNTGVFFVPTTHYYPYYLGEKGLKKEALLEVTPPLNEDKVMWL